jgi:protease I
VRALIIAASGVQDVEFVYPYYRLQEAGYEVEVAAPSLDKFQGIGGLSFQPTRELAHLGLLLIDLVVLPGGVKAMEKLRLESGVLDFIRATHAEGKIIASICSGAQLLISAGIVKGRKISAYYAMRVDVENAGAEFVDAPAVVDGRIITSPHYKHLGAWMSAVLIAAQCPDGFAHG